MWFLLKDVRRGREPKSPWSQNAIRCGSGIRVTKNGTPEIPASAH